MEKKRLFRILSKADRKDVIHLGEELQQQYSLTIVKKPEKSLVMIKMREPVKNSLFYLGETIITEAVVQLEDTVGTAVTMGDDFERRYIWQLLMQRKIKVYLFMKTCYWSGNKRNGKKWNRKMPCFKKQKWIFTLWIRRWHSENIASIR